MTGLYIHIPFCRSRCIYCGFYSTTLSDLQDAYMDAVCQEMRMRPTPPISTIYLGGGTPSQLSPALLSKLFHNMNKVYNVAPDAEITIECNPDDIVPVSQGSSPLFHHPLPINRVSMGAQTFSDDRLRFLHRRHTSSQVKEAVTHLRNNGISNISIDLMFGFPGETLDEWQNDISQALALNVEHISAYSLMYEEGTPLYQYKQQHPELVTDEELERQMYEMLIDQLTAAGYEHYEISNFAKPSFRSRHNSSYWNETPYIGLGAAAHSYDLRTRSWNIADVREYIRLINHHQLPVEETENLDTVTRYNDLITTALRTREGICLNTLRQEFGQSLHDYLLRNAQPHLTNQLLAVTPTSHLHLTRSGLFVSDAVMSDLIYIEPDT